MALLPLMEEKYRRIEEELEKRIVEAKKFAPFFKFEKEGDEICGRLLYTRKIRRGDEEEDTVWVIETFDREQYTLPSYAYLEAALADAEPGDYVKIRYAGEGRGGRGKSRAKLFDVAVLPKEEAEALLAEQPPAPPKPPEKPIEAPKPKEEAKKPEEKPTKPPEKPREVKLSEKAQLEKAESMLKTFAEFYGEVPVRTVEERLKKAGIEIPLDELLEKFPVLRREGDVLKRA